MLQVTISAAALAGLGLCIGALASLIWAIRRDPKSGR
jgi:hypothetical protein